MRKVIIAVGLVSVLAQAKPARAGLADWEVNEVYLGPAGSPNLRFVELVNQEGGCLFPATTLDLYDGAGSLLDVQSLVLVTECFAAPTYLLLASSVAADFFSVPRDGNLSSELPVSGQLCFSSSQTNYDCLRWGDVSGPVVDLFGASDTSVVGTPADGFSMARIGSTHVVASDWQSATPTPGQPNDGSVWERPDAGPRADAGPRQDAAPPADAATRSDASSRPDARAARESPEYLDLDTVGGAGCGCQSDGGADSRLFLVALVLLGIRGRRHNRLHSGDDRCKNQGKVTLLPRCRGARIRGGLD